jgi:PIN domain nuclease of toxin-antitoxin system
MRVLLDTHTFLWFVDGSDELSDKARGLIEDVNNQRFLSVASLWEMSIKVSIGKLNLDFSFPDLVIQKVYGNAIDILSISPEHLEQLAKMPFHHKDPFDRLIIAQGLTENMPIITRDRAFASYQAYLLW